MSEITRERGYYWIKFDYTKANQAARKVGLFAPFKNATPHWEVASWDSAAEMWAMIGSSDLWYDTQIEEVGPMIGSEPIELTRSMKKK